MGRSRWGYHWFRLMDAYHRLMDSSMGLGHRGYHQGLNLRIGLPAGEVLTEGLKKHGAHSDNRVKP